MSYEGEFMEKLKLTIGYLTQKEEICLGQFREIL
jgi:hypothetical protein